MPKYNFNQLSWLLSWPHSDPIALPLRENNWKASFWQLPVASFSGTAVKNTDTERHTRRQWWCVSVSCSLLRGWMVCVRDPQAPEEGKGFSLSLCSTKRGLFWGGPSAPAGSREAWWGSSVEPTSASLCLPLTNVTFFLFDRSSLSTSNSIELSLTLFTLNS